MTILTPSLLFLYTIFKKNNNHFLLPHTPPSLTTIVIGVVFLRSHLYVAVTYRYERIINGVRRWWEGGAARSPTWGDGVVGRSSPAWLWWGRRRCCGGWWSEFVRHDWEKQKTQKKGERRKMKEREWSSEKSIMPLHFVGNNKNILDVVFVF